jgi:hypothetical protein
MKTSDKLLLTFSLSSLGIFGLVHLSLYAKYNRGDFTTPHTPQEINKDQFSRHPMPAPGFISVVGLLRVNIIPSDTFAIELENQNNDGPHVVLNGIELKASYHLDGDTLIINGVNHLDKISEMVQNNSGVVGALPQVNIYCRRLKMITAENAYLTVTGEDHPVMSTASLLIKDAICLIGTIHAESQSPAIHYDSHRIASVNSTVKLRKNVDIKRLGIQLDDNSLLEDGRDNIGRQHFEYTDRSSFHLSGRNLKRLCIGIP